MIIYLHEDMGKKSVSEQQFINVSTSIYPPEGSAPLVEWRDASPSTCDFVILDLFTSNLFPHHLLVNEY